jgi:hypothetical protein
VVNMRDDGKVTEMLFIHKDRFFEYVSLL